MTVLPRDSGRNPYFSLFYGALTRRGVALVPGAEYQDLRWFAANRAELDWVHFHWLQYIYNEDSLVLTARKAARFVRFVTALRGLGLGILWTSHNLLPHESRSRVVDYAVRIAMLRLADLVVVHSDSGRRALARYFFRRTDTITLRHGHFIGCYPRGLPRAAARARLGIAADALVYLFFGTIRPYKGIDELIQAFRDVRDVDARLVIAGQPMSSDYGDCLRKDAEVDPRILTFFGHVPDSDVETYFAAADLTVLPFRNVLTSSTLLLSLSLGVPVILPRRPSLLEYVRPDVAHVYDNRRDLGAALTRARQRLSTGELRSGSQVIEWARHFDWDEGAASLTAALSHRLS